MHQKVFQYFLIALGLVLLCGAVVVQAAEDSSAAPWLIESTRAGGLTPPKRPHQIFARSFRWVPIKEAIGGDRNVLGDVLIERWVNEPPKDLAGKYVLIEVWATWCPPCRRGLPLLNYLQEKYGEELVVVAICETDETALAEMRDPISASDIKCHLAIDTHRRLRNQLGAYGIPHAILIEPTEGVIIWEGMPTFIGHEFSAEKVEKVLEVGRRQRSEGKFPKESPVKITVKAPELGAVIESPALPWSVGRDKTYGMPSIDADTAP